MMFEFEHLHSRFGNDYESRHVTQCQIHFFQGKQRAGQHDSFGNPGFNQLFIPSACFNDTATRHTLQEEFSRLTRSLLATQEQQGKCEDDHKGRLYSIVHVQNPISQITTNEPICAFETGNIFAATASPCFCRPLCEAKFAEVIYVISTLL